MRTLPAIRLPQASWPLVDQGVISLGTFLFNIVLARHVPLADYGRFAMFLGVLSLLQAGCGSALFYPLSIRAARADEGRRLQLVFSTLLLTMAICLPMAVVLGSVVWWFIDGALLLPAFAVLVSGQLQEAARRGLLCDFRHRAAIPGDAVSYLGQAVLLLAVAGSFELDLSVTLLLMAATSLAGAAIQIAQLRLRGASFLPWRPLLEDFWSLGKWSLTSNFLGIARLQSLPWLLAHASGPAAAGVFQIALNIFNMTSPILMGVCNIVPQAAARSASGDPRDAWTAAWPFIGAGIPLIGCFALVMLVAPAEIVALVYGDAGDAGAVSAIRILAVASILGYAGATGCAFLHGVDAGREALVADIATTLTMLAAAVPLTLAYGIEGGCAALTIAFALRTAIIGAVVVQRIGRSDPGTVLPAIAARSASGPDLNAKRRPAT